MVVVAGMNLGHKNDALAYELSSKLVQRESRVQVNRIQRYPVLRSGTNQPRIAYEHTNQQVSRISKRHDEGLPQCRTRKTPRPLGAALRAVLPPALGNQSGIETVCRSKITSDGK